MRTNQGITTDSTKSRAFTLIEMIGVLAVIAILAALLIPKVFEAIHSARIGNASTTINTVKTAVVDHYAKFGSLASAAGANYDQQLLTEGFLDKPFAVKICLPANADVIVSAAGAAATACDGLGPEYNLDGTAVAPSAANDATGTFVVEAIMTDVTAEDARELSVRIDGDALSETLTTTADVRGRVIYDAPAGGLADVRVYITHR